MSVVIETTLGNVTVDLFTEERPRTCLNFLKLCKIKYYNLCLFHNVTNNFIAQTGDPTGKGDGGESIYGFINGIKQRFYEAEKLPRIKHNQVGLLSMVSHGNGLLGSQFIITLADDTTSLDQEHCVFGQVVEGGDLLQKLNEVITDSTHRPYQDVRVTHTVVLDDPFPDPPGLIVPPSSPVPPSTRDAAYSRIPADEPLTEKYSPEELDEMVKQREAAARATILEMVGDIPDADIAPPENVLFVCKLNPVTTDHDLSIIFSRFGAVKSCEVIRDQISGDSLQYAFVEFENKEACEAAYAKMDNVLIDDRRIHVDFSQSVAKYKWKGKGKGVITYGGQQGGRKKENNYQRREVKRENDKRENGNHSRHEINNRHQYNQHVVPRKKTDIPIKREKKRREKTNKKKKRRSTTSSSTTDTSSSVESTDSDYKTRKKRSRKVLVVVKTPRRNKTKKKTNKVKKKNKKYESDSYSESEIEILKKKKRKKKKVTSESSSSSSSSSDEEMEERNKKRRKNKKRENSSERDEKINKKKRKRNDSSNEDESGEDKKIIKTKPRKRKHSTESTSESDVQTKKRKLKLKQKSKKLKKKYASSTSDSTSSSN